MKRSLIASTVALLALGAAFPAAAPDLGVGQAWAAEEDDRAKKEERKVLKLSDMDAMSKNEAYRQMAREKRHESMRFLKDILDNRAPQGTQKAEMMLRLAELYFEEGRDLYLDEMKQYQVAYDACFNDPACASKLETMKSDSYTVESRKWADRAIKLYRLILENYPQYQRADEATFFLANALVDVGQRKDAVEEYTRLVRTYPESAFQADAYVQIGEYYFDENNAYKALLAYQKAVRFKDSPQYAFANYKLAWCYYNVGEYGKAIETMKGVVAFTMTGLEGQDPDQKRLSLEDEALKDLVRFFADAGQMNEAYEYFNKLGKKDLIRAMLKRLASTYFEQGKFEECIQTYRRLIAEEPQGSDAPEYQNEIILAYQKIGRKKETLAEIDRLLKTYGRNSAWARANSADQDAVKDAESFIEKNLRTVAINFHDEARKLGTGSSARETYDLAEKAYSVYMQEFPEGKHAYQMRYAYGELLYKLKKYDEAYGQYMKVVAIDPNGQHSEFCAESAIFAAEEMAKSEAKQGRGAKLDVKKTESVPLTEWEQNMLTACDQYAKIFKDNAKTRNVIYKSAYLLYNHNQFKEASDRFRVVISMNPQSKEAEQAANLILDSFALVEDWANLKDVSKAFYDQEGLGSKSFKQEVYNIYERASFKFVEVTFEKDKDERKAGEAYMAFYAEFPKSEVADLALNNAAFYFRNQGQIAKSMEARQAIIDNFPKSKFYKNQVASLGFDYESIADFGMAAQWYEELFKLDGMKEYGAAHEGTKDALYSAALFRRAAGEPDKAIADLSKFTTEYKDDERVPAIMIDIATILEKQGKINESANAWASFFTKPPAGATTDQIFYARLQYGLNLEQSNQQSKADKHWKETLALYAAEKAKGTEMPAATEFVARIMTKQAEDQWQRYMDMKISGPGKSGIPQKQIDKVLLQQLTDKAKALQEVEKTYVEIVRTGAGEWGLASLVKLGKAYENMSESLKTSYVPTYLTEDQAELYRMGLEDKAYVQVEKATNVYSQALEKSYELNLYNENTAFATRRLGELRPDDFPVLFEDLLDPRFTSRARVQQSFEQQP